ncbi:SH3 domain-containing protein [Croceibacterium sp. TMG7-5b_MA50]|uniref:SH3 domain-containing protein n=1 Tax=Croceibacterium sp. TMG7-5b_MA50 TaxID=3121290 RepID=UPI00322162CF
MRLMLATLILLATSACRQDEAPAEKIEQTAEQLIEPDARPTPLARGRFAPHDDCADVAGAANFRAQLSRAVEARDAAAMAGLAASDIKLDFGGGSGVAELQRRLADPQQDLWAELSAILPLGCAADESGGVMIPWIAAQDLGDRDPFYSMLVLGEGVPVRSAPAAGAPEIGKITWDLVQISSLQPGAAFQQIKLPDERSGFIASDMLRSPVDYRLTASSRNGKWSITSLVSGD